MAKLAILATQFGKRISAKLISHPIAEFNTGYVHGLSLFSKQFFLTLKFFYMARMTKGPMGKFRGKVGTIVGSDWKGQQIIRSLPDVSNVEPTAPQLVQRAQMKATVNFIKPLKELVSVTFKERTANQTGFNAATKYNFRNALAGDYPNYVIDFTKTLVADGSLPRTFVNPVTADPAGGILKFVWTDNSGIASAKATDKVILVAYCEELKDCVYTIGPALRSEATANLAVPGYRGKTVHTWLSFISANDRFVATSVYTGSILVP
jgi:hypothetical protein